MKITNNQMRSFAFFSANLHQLMPDTPFEQHPGLFHQAQHYNDRALDEGSNLEGLHHLMQTTVALPAKDRPGMVATFHTGPYRLLPMYLSALGYPITMIVSADIVQEQQAWYERIHSELVSRHPDAAPYECLAAEDPMVIRKMVRAVQTGRFLVIYVDGHTGVGTSGQSSHAMQVNLCGRPIRVRTGVAALARLTGAPVYPMTAYFNEQMQPRLDICQPLDFLTGVAFAEATRSMMEKLYLLLDAQLQSRPMQWEGWFNIHHDLVGARSRNTGGLLRHYLPFEIDNCYFLLHKDSLSVYRLNKEIYQKLAAKFAH